MTLSYDNSECREVAAELLRRHGELQAEANITSAIRDFLIRTGLVETNEIREEISPAEAPSVSLQERWIQEIQHQETGAADRDAATALEAIRVSLSAEQSMREKRRIVLE